MNLVTERLIIRELKMSDLDRFDPLANSDFVLKYLCMYRMDREGSRQYLQQMIEKQKDFAVALKDTDELIGKLSEYSALLHGDDRAALLERLTVSSDRKKKFDTLRGLDASQKPLFK